MAEIQYIITEKEWKEFQEYRNDDLPYKVRDLSAIIGRYRTTGIDHQQRLDELNDIIDEQNLLIAGYKVKLKELEDG